MRLSELILTQGESMQYGVYLIRPRITGAGRRLPWPTNFGMTAINILALGLLPTSLIGIAVWAQRNGFGLLNWMGLGLMARWEATRSVGKMQIGLEEVRGKDARGLLSLLVSPVRNQLSGSKVAHSGLEPRTSEVSR